MTIHGLDIRYNPFSTYGSYMAINYLESDYYVKYADGSSNFDGFGDAKPQMPEGLYLRSVRSKGQTGSNMEMCALIPQLHGKDVSYSIEADESCIALKLPEDCTICFCFDDEDTVLVYGQGAGVGLKIDFIFDGRSGVYSIPVHCQEGTFFKTGCGGANNNVLGLYIQHGKVEDHCIWEEPNGMMQTQCIYQISETENSFLFSLHEIYYYVWPEKKSYCFEKAVTAQREKFEAYCQRFPEYPAEYEAMKRLAIYTLWSGTVKPRDFIQRDTVFVTKNFGCLAWGYENYACGWGLCEADPQLAYNQIMTLLDHQNELGGIPHSFGDSVVNFEAQMAPSAGFMLTRMLEKMTITDGQAEELYEKLSRHTNYYLNYMDVNQDGLPEYFHGNDACYDGAAMFIPSITVTSPDLATFLIFQMDLLADLAIRLNRLDSSRIWKERSDEMLEKMIKKLFDADHMPIIFDNNTREIFHVQSTLIFAPLALGNRLPKEIRETMIRCLTDGNYIHEAGLATEPTNSPYYKEDGFFRGPVWWNTTLLIAEGLRVCGEEKLSKEVAKKFCDTVAKEYCCAECFNVHSGKAYNNKSYTPTAGTFLALPRFYF